ncbi:hypothetical protein D918_06951 [Trichuris suis]|nr:hypothetical protein D918_06951 [Trichuris suis]
MLSRGNSVPSRGSIYLFGENRCSLCFYITWNLARLLETQFSGSQQGSMSGTVYLPDKNQDYKPSCALT